MDNKAFKEHPLWELVGTCSTQVQELPDEADEFAARFQSVANYVRRFQRHGDSALFSPGMLDTMRNIWAQLTNQLQYVAGNPVGYIPSAHQVLDQIVTQAGTWPAPWTNTSLSKAMQDSLTDYQATVESTQQKYLASIEDLSTQVEALSKERDSLSEKIASLEEDLKTQAEKLDSQATTQTTTFNEAQTKRSTDFDQWLSSRRVDLDKVCDDNKAELAKYKADAETELEQIKQTREGVDKVAGAAASDILASDYGQYSQHQFWAAIASFVGGIALLVWAGFVLKGAFNTVAPNQPASWQWVALKITLTATIVGGASFVLALGNRFLRNSTNTKRVELELRAIGPFLSDVDEEQAHDAKIELVERMFGHSWDPGSPKGEEDTVSVGTMAQVVEIMTKVAKGFKQP